MSSEEKRGMFNSSKTRVYPAFKKLCENPNGIDEFLNWLSEVGVPLPKCGKVNPNDVYFDGHQGERGFYPSEILLEWLISEKCIESGLARMTKDMPREGLLSETAKKRALLFSPIKERRSKVRSLIKMPINPQGKAWYVLEGATKPDVTIETDTYILVIEGKRTEPHLTDRTTWMKHRDQMIRHLDGVYEYVRKKNLQKKVFGLFIIAERDDVAFTKYNRPIPNYKMCKYGGGKYRRGSGKSCWEESLPHRSPAERAEMQDGFIGFVTWADIKKRWTDIEYPEVVND